MELNHVYHGDCLEVMQSFPDDTFHALVCDPPAGISFMNKLFDSDRGGRNQWIAWLAERMQEVLRVMKPGAHGLVWALPRTSYWTMMALEDAGFEVRDTVHHIFATGMPKGIDVAKDIDRTLGAKRKMTRTPMSSGTKQVLMSHPEQNQRPWILKAAENGYHEHPGKEPATPEAAQWDGWNTTLKPSIEYWVLVRKPIAEQSIARQVLATGTGGLNIEACRVGTASDMNPRDFDDTKRISPKFSGIMNGEKVGEYRASPGAVSNGRWPAHLVLSHDKGCSDSACEENCPVGILDMQSGVRTSGKSDGFAGPYKASVYSAYAQNMIRPETIYGDTGGASRYFTRLPYSIPLFQYMPKASPSDRTMDGQVENDHPTTKSTKLMEWLITLITPPGGVVFDPFCGSGSTLIAAERLGFDWVGIDENTGYVDIARARLRHARRRTT